MIDGWVRNRDEPVVRLSVFDSTDRRHEIDFVIDTGFSGTLLLTPKHAKALNLAWMASENAELADGSITRFDYYQCRLEWGEQIRTVPCAVCDGVPLVGTQLLADHELRIQFTQRGLVTIRPCTDSSADSNNQHSRPED